MERASCQQFNGFEPTPATPWRILWSCAATCFELLGPCRPDPNGINAGRSPCPCAGFSETRLGEMPIPWKGRSKAASVGGLLLQALPVGFVGRRCFQVTYDAVIRPAPGCWPVSDRCVPVQFCGVLTRFLFTREQNAGRRHIRIGSANEPYGVGPVASTRLCHAAPTPLQANHIPSRPTRRVGQSGSRTGQKASTWSRTRSSAPESKSGRCRCPSGRVGQLPRTATAEIARDDPVR